MSRKTDEIMNSQACRFCLKISRIKISIDADIKEKFHKLMNEELLDGEDFPQTCCKTCITEIDRCNVMKDKISANQNLLYKLYPPEVKEEPEFSMASVCVVTPEMVFVKAEEVQHFPDNEKSFTEEIEAKDSDPGSSNIDSDKDSLDSDLDKESVDLDFDKESNLSFDIGIGKSKTQSNENKSDKNSDVEEDVPPSRSDLMDKDYDYEADLKTRYIRNTRTKKTEPHIGRHNCHTCERSYQNQYSLRAHIRKSHPSIVMEKVKDTRKKVKCENCDKVFSVHNIVGHRIAVHGLVDEIQFFTCDICGAKRRTRDSIHNHMNMHITGGITWNCKDCNRSFKTRSRLNYHRRYHHDMTISVICELCGAQFKQRSHLNLHMQSAHTTERPYQCTQCEKAFLRPSGLKCHIKDVHGTEKFQCEHCSKFFKSKTNLKDHVLFVHAPKTKSCTYPGCDFKYIVKKNLLVHIYKKHTDSRKYQCKTCSASFREKEGLINHVLTIHLNYKFNCLVDGCKSKFHRKDYFRRHVKKIHKNLGADRIQQLSDQIGDFKLPDVSEFCYTVPHKLLVK